MRQSDLQRCSRKSRWCTRNNQERLVNKGRPEDRGALFVFVACSSHRREVALAPVAILVAKVLEPLIGFVAFVRPMARLGAIRAVALDGLIVPVFGIGDAVVAVIPVVGLGR